MPNRYDVTVTYASGNKGTTKVVASSESEAETKAIIGVTKKYIKEVKTKLER